MTFPKISAECLLATVTKASQTQAMDEFAAGVMMDMTIEQPETMAAIVALLEPWLKPQPEIQTVELAQAQDVMLQACFVVLGVVMKSMAAQQEADEMNEAWGDEE